MQGGQRSLVELFRNPVMRAGRFLDACAWRLGCFLPDRRLPTPRTGSVRPWGYPGRGLLTTPSRGYPKSSPLPKIPAPAGSHLAHQITSNPRLWPGFAHHLLIWGVAALPCRIFTPPTPVSGGLRPDTAGPPPGRPLSRRGRGAALPPGGTAPAAARSCLASSLHFDYFFIIFIPWPSQGPGGAALSARWGLQAVA